MWSPRKGQIKLYSPLPCDTLRYLFVRINDSTIGTTAVPATGASLYPSSSISNTLGLTCESSVLLWAYSWSKVFAYSTTRLWVCERKPRRTTQRLISIPRSLSGGFEHWHCWNWGDFDPVREDFLSKSEMRPILIFQIQLFIILDAGPIGVSLPISQDRKSPFPISTW